MHGTREHRPHHPGPDSLRLASYFSSLPFKVIVLLEIKLLQKAVQCILSSFCQTKE